MRKSLVMSPMDLTKLRDVCAQLGVVALFLHGSRAEERHREDSDIDFAYLLAHGRNPGPVEDRLLPLLAETYGVDEAEVDLQNLRQSPPTFRVRVFDHGQLLFCGDPTDLARFHAGSLSENWDLQYFLRPFREAMRQRIREGRFAS